MSFYGVDPVRFYGPSHVTATLTGKHPEVGSRANIAGRDYVWAYNDGGSDINPGYGAVLQSGATGMSVTVSAVTSADIVVGVCYHSTLTTATYGWLLTRGIGKIEANATSGTFAAKDLIEIGANGDWNPVSNTTGNLAPANGCALEAIVSSASGAAYISVF
jgi:hypothetical protein